MPRDGTGNHFWSICVEEQFYMFAPFVIVFFRKLTIPILCAVVALGFYAPHTFSAIALGVLLAIADRNMAFTAAMAVLAAVFYHFFAYGIWMPFLAVAIVGSAAVKGAPTAIGKLLGGASYSFYLNHWIGLFGISALIKLGVPFWLSAAFGFLVALAVSLAHYQTVDRFIAKNRAAFFSRRIGVACCASGLVLFSVGALVGTLVFRN
jgi:peptidoglycan/LPS O-acetylase OafA/YrhL